MKVPFNQCMNRNFGVRLKTQLLLVFAAIFIVMMIVPGHIMNKQMKKQCLKN